MRAVLREPTVVVTVRATRVADLEAKAYERAKSAFEAYGSGTDWKTASGEQLEAVRESDIYVFETPRLTLGDSPKPLWEATYRVGVLP